MSYDIPDKIQYKEKIVFGLDVKQLMYFAVFGLLAFFSLNLPLQGNAKFILPVIFLIIGAGFVFLNLEERLLDVYYFYTGIRKVKSSEAKAQRFMEIKEIKDDTVQLTNGGLRSILEVEPINFSLLDDSQKKAVILNYREFLNHLTTPIQILVRTDVPDLEEYFNDSQERLSQTSAELREVFDDFLMFEQDFLEKNNVRERNYYVIVSHEPSKSLIGKIKPDAEEEVKSLEQKTKIIEEKLLACGLKSKRLETEELRSFFAPYSSHEQEPSEEELLEEAFSQAYDDNWKPTKKRRKTAKKRPK